MEICLMLYSLLQQILNKKKNSWGFGDLSILPLDCFWSSMTVSQVSPGCAHLADVSGISLAGVVTAVQTWHGRGCPFLPLTLLCFQDGVPRPAVRTRSGSWKGEEIGSVGTVPVFYTRYAFSWAVASERSLPSNLRFYRLGRGIKKKEMHLFFRPGCCKVFVVC